MGTLRYDGEIIEFEDRLLTHLQIVIVQRLRLGESLLMSWLDPISIGDGRSSVWLTPAAPLHFKFAGSRVPTINRTWLDLLNQSASSSTGLIVVGEDGRPAHADDHVLPRVTQPASPKARIASSTGRSR